MPGRNENTVLIIDDDAEDRAALRTLLTEAGFAVAEAADGKTALHYLTGELEPALIVTDLAMPDMTGWELINILHAYVRLSVIPVIVVSGVDFRHAPAHEEGVPEIFKKPLDPTPFIAAVNRHCLSAEQREARRLGAAKRLESAPF